MLAIGLTEMASPANMPPFPPLRMKADMAAYLLGISESKLKEGAKSGIYPAPVRDGKNVLWKFEDLKTWVDGQQPINALAGGW